MATGLISWLAFFGQLTSETQVRAMIQRESPYVEDRAVIMELRATVRELTTTVVTLNGKVEALNALIRKESP